MNWIEICSWFRHNFFTFFKMFPALLICLWMPAMNHQGYPERNGKRERYFTVRSNFFRGHSGKSASSSFFCICSSCQNVWKFFKANSITCVLGSFWNLSNWKFPEELQTHTFATYIHDKISRFVVVFPVQRHTVRWSRKNVNAVVFWKKWDKK